MTRDGALAAFQPIQNSPAAPCPMQRDVAAHNTAYDSLKSGRLTVYRAPCDADRKKGKSEDGNRKPEKPEPKTS